MKIVIAIHHFPPRYVSGAEKETFRVAKGLQARGHQVQIVCVEDIVHGPDGSLEFTDTEYEGLAVRRLSFNLAAAPDPWLWRYNNPWIGAHLKVLLKEQKPDLFFLVSGYLMTASAVQAAHEAGVPIALYLTDFWFLCPRITMLRSDGSLSSLPIDPVSCARCLGEEKRRYRWLGKLVPQLMQEYWRAQTTAVNQVAQRSAVLRKAIADVDVVITPSRFLHDMYDQAGFLAKPDVFIRQGLDRIPDRSTWSQDELGATLRVGYIGQIAPHKGVHVLVEAVRELKNSQVTLTVYGDLTAFPAYTRQLQEKTAGDERIRLAGVFQGAERLREIMAGLDVMVVPSVWYENSPNAILEALSYGIPVITSNLGGMAELVQHEQNGLLFRSGDAEDLAAQLRRLLDEPGLLQRLRAGIQPVKGITEQIDEIEHLFLRIAAQTPSETSPA